MSAYTTPDGAPYGFTHDASLRLTAVTDPLGRVWQYVYDRAGRLVSETARREAAGEVVAVKQNGVPFDHIADLTNAGNGLGNVRKVLVKEMDVLPEGLTERGLDVLIKKHDETVYHLDRLNGILASIGHR